jgi:CubicO group peptidase (beta-lactamase class C family)
MNTVSCLSELPGISILVSIMKMPVEQDMRSSQSALPRAKLRLRLAVCLATLIPPFSHADDSAAISRIEAGLRPVVALADVPVKTERLQDAMARLKVPGVSVAVIHDGKVAWTRG